jgi:hypothetical protein
VLAFARPYDATMTQPNTPSRTGKRVAIVLVVLWVVVIVGLYAVLAKLKMGGAEALRKDAPGAHAPSGH